MFQQIYQISPLEMGSTGSGRMLEHLEEQIVTMDGASLKYFIHQLILVVLQ
jgi:hypothetical protein